MAKQSLPRVEADDHCFVCGQANGLGLKATLEIDRQQRLSRCRLRVPAGFQGWQNLVHGGILAALLDEACIYACRAEGEQFVTAELCVKYRKPVPVETELLVVGELLEQRKKVWQARSRIEIDGILHAEATAKVFALDESM